MGVLIILRPGTDAFKLASLLPIAAALGYATLHMLTRKMGKTESALTMSFYIQVTFIFTSCLFFLLGTDDFLRLIVLHYIFFCASGIHSQRMMDLFSYW